MRSRAKHHVGVFLVVAACVLSCHAMGLRRIASFPHGQVVTTRELLKFPYRSLIESPTQQPHVWVLGLQPRLEGQVHDTLLAQQGKLLHPLPGRDHHHWLVQATEAAVRALLDVHDDTTAAFMPHGLKVSPAVGEQISRKLQQDKHGNVALLLLLPAATDSQASFVQYAQRELNSMLGRSCTPNVRLHDGIVRISVCNQQAMQVVAWAAAQSDVTWVDIKTQRFAHSLYASVITQNPHRLHESMRSRTSPPPADVLNGTASGYFPLWKAGLTGKGQVVAIADTGIDMDSCFFHDTNNSNIYSSLAPLRVPCPSGYYGTCLIDNGLTKAAPVNHTSTPQHRKVVELITVSGRADTEGHGSLTAGILAGSQQGFNAHTDKPILGTGVCPECKLAVVDVGADKPAGVATIDDVPAAVFKYLEKQVGVRIVSQSSGLDANLGAYYGMDCFTLDKAAWDGSNLLHVFSAGNDGYLAQYERNTNGTVAMPANCKDVLSVGGTENWMSAQENAERALALDFTPFNVLTSNRNANISKELEYVSELRLPRPDQSNPGILTFSKLPAKDLQPLQPPSSHYASQPRNTSQQKSPLSAASPPPSPHGSVNSQSHTVPGRPHNPPTLQRQPAVKPNPTTRRHTTGAPASGYGYAAPPASPTQPNPGPSAEQPLSPSPRAVPSPPTAASKGTAYGMEQSLAASMTEESSAIALPDLPIVLNGSAMEFLPAPGFNSDFWQSLGRKLLERFNTQEGGTVKFQLVLADPIEGCSMKQNFNSSVQTMLLVRKSSVDIYGDYDYLQSTCSVLEAAMQAQKQGASAVLIYWEDDVYQTSPFITSSIADFFMPTPMITTPGIGSKLAELLSHGVHVEATWQYMPPFRPADALPFENIASWSSYSSLNSSQQTRFKPDLVAPGFQLSAHSDLQYTGKVDNCAVVRDEGTSMSAPVVAGAAALVRQWFTDGYFPSGVPNRTSTWDPSAALLKAVLIGGTSAMTGYSIVNRERLAPPPSAFQGYGRVDLSRALPLPINAEWRMQSVDNSPSTPVQLSGTGKSDQYTIEVLKAMQGPQPDLIVTLVWTDYPAYPGTASQFPLVNDLDLVVSKPGGTKEWGNGVTGGDRINNVEKVIISSAAPGVYTISVFAHYIFVGASPQPYSMVVLGHIGDLTQVLVS